ncbi:MAG: MoxR family ATPase [Longimicrobiales bacterium]|nr:MoxR family ATPase [Longimicrobiales bacterium]
MERTDVEEREPAPCPPGDDDNDFERRSERIVEAGRFTARVREAIGRRVVGQTELVDHLLMSLLVGGHVLLEGVPGLAKTLTVQSLADSLRVHFRRIQFTPDLLPADVVGTLIWDEHAREFTTKQGPIFANIVLADEVNRAPAKVQSALLEAMQEKQVTIGDESRSLPEPFLVLATQNPVEQEGTYPLPEAQVDRFMFKVYVDYPTRDEERTILRRIAGQPKIEIEPVAGPEDVLEARRLLPGIRVDERVEEYVLDLVQTTRAPTAHGLPEIEEWLEYGASPRATINLVIASRARAFLDGRAFVLPEDVRAVARPILRHRLVLTFRAEAEEVSTETIVDRILETVRVP